MKAAKSDCGMSFANLNLTEEQETELKAAAEECHKGGCSDESKARMNEMAKQILTEQQYATWKDSGGCAAKGAHARS
jgi:hypothetical protein